MLIDRGTLTASLAFKQSVFSPVRVKTARFSIERDGIVSRTA